MQFLICFDVVAVDRRTLMYLHVLILLACRQKEISCVVLYTSCAKDSFSATNTRVKNFITHTAQGQLALRNVSTGQLTQISAIRSIPSNKAN